eukprot:4891587-Ditylum_brightwellii.AAC.1
MKRRSRIPEQKKEAEKKTCKTEIKRQNTVRSAAQKNVGKIKADSTPMHKEGKDEKDAFQDAVIALTRLGDAEITKNKKNVHVSAMHDVQVKSVPVQQRKRKKIAEEGWKKKEGWSEEGSSI